MQDPFFGMIELWADGREMIAEAIGKDEKSGEECPLFGWNDRYKVAPYGFVCRTIFLPVSQFVWHGAIGGGRDPVSFHFIRDQDEAVLLLEGLICSFCIQNDFRGVRAQDVGKERRTGRFEGNRGGEGGQRSGRGCWSVCRGRCWERRRCIGDDQPGGGATSQAGEKQGNDPEKCNFRSGSRHNERV